MGEGFKISFLQLKMVQFILKCEIVIGILNFTKEKKMFSNFVIFSIFRF